jgi:hypothetical protein
VVTTQSSSTVPAGNVISQNPVAGTSVAAGSAVNLVVSTGPAPVAVPNVVGLTQAAANAITGAGLVVGDGHDGSRADGAGGQRDQPEPVGRTSVAAGSAVNLVVSTGPGTGGGAERGGSDAGGGGHSNHGRGPGGGDGDDGVEQHGAGGQRDQSEPVGRSERGGGLGGEPGGVDGSGNREVRCRYGR